jgi:hypothetical protein
MEYGFAIAPVRDFTALAREASLNYFCIQHEMHE